MTNFEEVIDVIRDDKQSSEMANCAFEEIILNRQFHYESFADKLDLAIDGVLARKGGMSVTSCAGRGMQSARNPRALLLAGHEPTMDPRIDWMAEGLTADFEVCELGACDDNSDGAGPSFERLSDRRIRVRVARHAHDWDVIPDIQDMATQSSTVFQHLMLLYIVAELPAKALGRSIGAIGTTTDDLSRFRGAARHFLHTNCALLQAGRLIGHFDI